MSHSPTKFGSDSALNVHSLEKTPPPSAFVSQRIKRRLEEITRADFDEFKDEIRKMLASFKTNYDNIEHTLSNIEKNITFSSQQQDEMQVKIKSLEEECKINNSNIISLQEKVEDLQRCSKLTTIELRNIPKKAKENKQDLLSYVSNICKKLNVELHNSNVRDIYRVPGKPDTKKPVIVQLSDLFLRNTLLSAVKTYNSTNPSNKLNMSHLGLEGRDPIYLAENLTANARKLYFHARELRKCNKIKYCWISDGKVLIKKEDGDSSILIKTLPQLEQFNTSD